MNPALTILLDPGSAASPGPAALPAALMAWPARPGAPGTFQTALQDAARATGLPPALLAAVEWQESGADPGAVSAAGAIGLMQLMPGTAAALSVNPWNPAQNLLGGATYLAEQLRRFGGNLPDALAAYNAGPGAVEAYGGVPPYPETQRYVADVMALYRKYSA